MLSYCGTCSVLSCHPQADVSLHAIVCKHFAFSRNLFKQYFWSSKNCFISFSVSCISIFEEKQRTIISFSFNSCFTDNPLFITQLGMEFYYQTDWEVKPSLYKIAINDQVLKNACLKNLDLLFHWISTQSSRGLIWTQAQINIAGVILFFIC